MARGKTVERKGERKNGRKKKELYLAPMKRVPCRWKSDWKEVPRMPSSPDSMAEAMGARPVPVAMRNTFTNKVK